MIKQLSVGLKMMRYAYGIWVNVMLWLAILLAGIGMFSLSASGTGSMGAYFLSIGAICTQQIVYSLAASKLIQSSPWKKHFETSIPALISFVALILSYVLVLALSALRISSNPEQVLDVGFGVVISAAMMCIVMIYGALAYKFFVVTSIVFFVVVYGMMFSSVWFDFSSRIPKLSFGMAVPLGFVLLFVGALAEYRISLLVYRVPLSKRSQLIGLRKWM
ncbi:MAG: hypothetical protein ACLT3H_06235 [Roseburia sp.]